MIQFKKGKMEVLKPRFGYNRHMLEVFKLGRRCFHQEIRSFFYNVILNCRYDVKPMAKILGFVDSAQDTVDWPTSPALGIKTILEQLKLKVDDVASYEINEAFSVVILANAKLLGLNLDKVRKILLKYLYHKRGKQL